MKNNNNIKQNFESIFYRNFILTPKENQIFEENLAKTSGSSISLDFNPGDVCLDIITYHHHKKVRILDAYIENGWQKYKVQCLESNRIYFLRRDDLISN